METIDRLSTFTKEKLDNAYSLDYARLFSAKVRTKSNVPGGDAMVADRALRYFVEYFPYSPSRGLMQKALTNPGTVQEPAWGAPLVTQPMAAGFLAFAKPDALPDQLLSVGSRKVPFNVSVATQTGTGVYGFVGEGAPKPAGNLSFASATLSVNKLSGIYTVSKELALLSAPGTEAALRDELANGANAAVNQAMLDPTAAPIAGTSPGGLIYASPSFGSAGSSTANAQADFKQGASRFHAANPRAARPVVIMSPANATAIGFALNVPDIATGSRVFGFTVIVNSAAGARLIFLDAGAVLIADNDQIDLSVTEQAAIELNSVPTSPPSSASVWVSTWQANLVGVRVDRWISWRLARPSSAVYSVVNYV